MRVIIVGFQSVAEIEGVMEKLISDNECYLFTVVCGGLDKVSPPTTPAQLYAEKAGAPVEFIYESTVERLFKKLLRTVDYMVIKVDKDTPATWKNFMMEFKKSGKHGTVIRGN